MSFHQLSGYKTASAVVLSAAHRLLVSVSPESCHLRFLLWGMSDMSFAHSIGLTFSHRL